MEKTVGGPEPDLDALEDGSVGKLLKPRDREGLLPWITVAVERSKWLLTGLEVSLDEGNVSAGDDEAAFAELELELKGGGPADLFDLAEALATQVPLRIGVLSKAERGALLADGRLGEAIKAEPLTLDPGWSVAEGVAAIVHACLRHYRLNEMVLLDRDDPAALHQTRVALRRLRSAFSLFGRVVRDDHYQSLREDLRWYTAQFGDSRNLDVFMRRLPETEAPGEATVRRALNSARVEAYARTGSALRSRRQRMMMLGLVRWVEIGEWRDRRKAGRPLGDFAPRRLDRRWRDLEEAGRSLSTLDPKHRHRVRIAVKKMRYAAEFLSSLYDKGSAARRRKAFIETLETLQDRLGELNDITTQQELVKSLGLRAAEDRDYAFALIGEGPDAPAALTAADQAWHRLHDIGRFWR